MAYKVTVYFRGIRRPETVGQVLSHCSDLAVRIWHRHGEKVHPCKEPSQTYLRGPGVGQSLCLGWEVSSAWEQAHGMGDTISGSCHPWRLPRSWQATQINDYTTGVSCATGWLIHPRPPFPSHLPAGGGFVIQLRPVRCKQRSGSWVGLLGTLLPSYWKRSLSADRRLHPSSFFLFLPRPWPWCLEV